MKQFCNFLAEVQKYSSAATSIRGKEVAALVKLFKSGMFVPGGTALDYGAGKYGRNAEFLRSEGIRTYAYDKFNGTSADGWNAVSLTIPNGETFDTGFTSYVLNVVPEEIEAEIIRDVESRTRGKVFHITRGTDITQTVFNVISGKSKNDVMMQFIAQEYPEIYGQIVANGGTKELAKEIATRGVVTAKDSFQRIPDLSKYGYKKSGSGASVVWTK
ncbi:hypothetical protein KVP40.0066 [Vibrio phage KVP40]|uniref:Uncharacterized protein n=1 Tax=Vibrio phage KVP40 (isolate Vibrio parahaemolyticus/Japan/Matsuzaki/1991) TaxID=75320 RepID=Q6WI85_BPKVM|nr:hypothetical protein KVP40.0066 [Vibrio phage KVP40]AAQ64137.1 hypothetical protein KVP40.0066 [Vibrio phage KVP40]WOL24977.1 hypothetical protein [Vibrio phage PG216]